jgi:excisionase family DNA binding protein
VSARKHAVVVEDSVDVDALARAAAVFIRDQVDVMLKERLPQLLSAGAGRRPPGQAPAPESLGPQYLTRQQVAQITGYSLRTITRMINSGRLRACGPNRDRVTRAEVDRMMAAASDASEGPSADPDFDPTTEVDRLLGH